MLGIVNPSLVSMSMLLRKIANTEINVIIVDVATREAKRIAQLFGEFVINVVGRTTSEAMCRSREGSNVESYNVEKHR